MAAERTGIKKRHDEFYGNGAIKPGITYAYYVIPFIVMFIIIVSTVVYGFFFSEYSFNEELTAIKEEKPLQANIIAVLLLSIMITVYTFLLDVIGLVLETTATLPKYFQSNAMDSRAINILFLIIYALFFIFGLFSPLCSLYTHCHGTPDTANTTAIRNTYVITFLLFFVSALLSLSFHFPYILMAWVTDPFYASRIAVFYAIIISIYFTGFHYGYIALCPPEDKQGSTQGGEQGGTQGGEQGGTQGGEQGGTQGGEQGGTQGGEQGGTQGGEQGGTQGGEQGVEQGEYYGCFKIITVHVKKYRCKIIIGKKYNCFKTFIGLSVIFVLISGVIMTVAIFVASIPVNNSIETSADGITTLYNGVVILIGGLVAYRIGSYYIGRTFSVNDALKKALKGLEKPQYYDGNDQKWQEEAEEGRLTAVIKELILKQQNAEHAP